MGKAAVRQAIANFLDPNISGVPIDYCSTVYQALPKIANEADLFSLQPDGQGIGAVIFFFLGSHVDTLKTFPALPGERVRVYSVDLLCILKSDAETALEGQEAFDDFIDSLTERILSDPEAGDPSVVFTWGTGDMTANDPDLSFEYPVPRAMSGGVMLFQGVGHVKAVEVYNAD